MISQKDIQNNASPILDSIFHPRKKISKYEPFTKQMRALLMEKFQTVNKFSSLKKLIYSNRVLL